MIQLCCLYALPIISFLFIPLHPVPTGPPQNLDITVQSSRDISLSWDPPPPREQNGIIREYLITVTEVETGSVLEFISTTTSLSVIMLHPYYTYQSAVAAMTIGVGPYSEVSTAVTHEEGRVFNQK